MTPSQSNDPSRHLLRFGGNFVPFVAHRAEGAFVYDAAGPPGA